MSAAPPLIGYREAYQRTLEAISPLTPRQVPLLDGVGQVMAEDVISRVNVPSSDASMKDGFAVRSIEITGATAQSPVRLSATRHLEAGSTDKVVVTPGTAVGVLTGAAIPQGADAVVASEFVHEGEGWIDVTATAHPGRNILPCGSDVTRSSAVVTAGQLLSPGKLGLLVAGGHTEIKVIPRPRVHLIATGTEVVVPGGELVEGQVYGSNVMTIAAWCRQLGMSADISYAEDDPEIIAQRLDVALNTGDAVITSGGAWTSRKDLLSPVLETMGWRQCYHRIRMGPGKAVGLGLLRDKPVFILPGGPPSNLMAFLQLALPGLYHLAGRSDLPLPQRVLPTGTELRGRQVDWTQFVYGQLEEGHNGAIFMAHRRVSRLRSMAQAEAIAMIPEGNEIVAKGTEVTVQVLPF